MQPIKFVPRNLRDEKPPNLIKIDLITKCQNYINHDSKSMVAQTELYYFHIFGIEKKF